MSITYDEGMVLTNGGRALEAEQRAAGKGLTFSRAVFGSGILPAETETMEGVEAMVQQEMELPLLRASVVGDGTARFVFLLDNTNVPAPGFPIREIGVFALNESGDEILYSYTNFGNQYGWMPSANGARVVSTEFSLSVVVGYTTEIHVTLDPNSSAFALSSELSEHAKDTNAHPELPHFGEDIATIADIKNLWVDNGDGKIHKTDLETLQKAVLGGDASTIPKLAGRISQQELELSNIAFALANHPKIIVSSTEPLDPRAYWVYRPDAESSLEQELFGALELSNMIFYDNFNPVSETDIISVKANAVTAGSRTIGLESLDGIHPGEAYTLTDGTKSELVQVKSASKNGNVLRVVCKSDVVGTYDLSRTYLYRTTAGLRNGSLLSAWHPGEEIIFQSKEFRADGIRKLAYTQGLVRHGKLKGVRIRAFATYLDEIVERENVSVGIGTGSRQTIHLPDAGIDYSTIRIFVDGNETNDFSANTETSPAEVTLTAVNGASITASYKSNYTDEDWQEMDLVTVQDYGDSGIIVSKFEHSLDAGGTEKTRTCIKWRLEAVDGTAQPVRIYGVAAGWAKAADVEV